MNIDTGHFKKLLDKELMLVETELKDVGRINPDNPADWEGKADDLNVMSADRNDVADKIDSYEGNTAILKQLEIRLNDIKAALARIESGTFGTCEVGGEEIEKDRLEANPAATTCKKHMNG